MKITSNRHWRQFAYRHEVPADVLRDQFDHHDPDEVTSGYFCYRGWWYHLDQFMQLPDAPFTDATGSGAGITWHGAHGDSWFSGVVIRLSDDGEEYQVGTYRQ